MKPFDYYQKKENTSFFYFGEIMRELRSHLSIRTSIWCSRLRIRLLFLRTMAFLDASILAKPIRIYWSIILLLFVGIEVNAQNSAQIRLTLDCDCAKLQRKYGDAMVATQEWPEFKSDLSNELNALGYYHLVFTENLDGEPLEVFLNPGRSFKWFNVKVDASFEKLVRASGVNLDRLHGDRVTLKSVNELKEKPLRFLENHGFPFASVYLDSLEFDSAVVRANLIIDRGPFVKIDSVSIKGDLEIRASYITNYLGIKPGSEYNEQAVSDAYDRLRTLSFASQIQPPQVFFNDNETKVEVYLSKKKASRFDGLVGFLPDAETGRLQVTGDARIHLENAWAQGEVIDINWRKLQTRTQQLKGFLVTPFVFNSPISVDLGGEIYRRDTLFSEVKGEAGVRYVFNQNNYFRAFVSRSNVRLLATSPYQNQTSVPPFLDRNLLSYGVGGNYEKLDYRLNPSKGVFCSVDISAGNKVIIKNVLLSQEIYENLELRTLQLNGEARAGYAISPLKRVVWFQSAEAKTIFNNQLFNNEAHRIGGLLSVRGFNEESIFATSYAILKSELRYQIDRDGYVFGFVDGAWYENKSLNRIGPGRDTPFGFGAGLSFGTKAGIFNISYALGKEQNNPILLRNNKIHFGFLSVF